MGKGRGDLLRKELVPVDEISCLLFGQQDTRSLNNSGGHRKAVTV